MKQILNTLTNSDFISKCTNYIYIYIIHTFITCQLFPKDNLFAANLSTGSALKPGRVILVTFSPGLTRIGSREKRNCSFDDVETYKRYRVALL